MEWANVLLEHSGGEECSSWVEAVHPGTGKDGRRQEPSRALNAQAWR